MLSKSDRGANRCVSLCQCHASHFYYGSPSLVIKPYKIMLNNRPPPSVRYVGRAVTSRIDDLLSSSIAYEELQTALMFAHNITDTVCQSAIT